MDLFSIFKLPKFGEPALIYCRWDVSADPYQYRSITSLKACAKLPQSKPAKDRLGSQHVPLFDVDPQHVVIDELHLLLRITDILIRNLIFEMLRLDKKGNVTGVGSQQHLKSFVKAVRSCGVSFDVWEARDGDGKPLGKYQWTALPGRDKKQLLQQLPSKLRVLVPENIGDTVVSLWNVRVHQIRWYVLCVIAYNTLQDFLKIYKIISAWNPTTEQRKALPQMVTQ